MKELYNAAGKPTNRIFPDAAADKKPSKKKYSKAYLWFLLLVPIAALLIIAALDVAGLRTAAMKLINGKQEEQPQQTSALEKEQEKLQIRWDELEKREAEQKGKEGQLAVREQSIREKEEETLRINEEAKALQSQLAADVKELMDVVALYEEMEPENAARILELLKEQDMAVVILKNMKEDKASAILEEMQPAIAAEIVHQMLYP